MQDITQNLNTYFLKSLDLQILTYKKKEIYLVKIYKRSRKGQFIGNFKV